MHVDCTWQERKKVEKDEMISVRALTLANRVAVRLFFYHTRTADQTRKPHFAETGQNDRIFQEICADQVKSMEINSPISEKC